MEKPISLSSIVAQLDIYLQKDAIRDYCNAMNGLQLQNSGTVHRVVAAVDACESVIHEASLVNGTLLVVHHGLFWQGLQPITGHFYRNMKYAIEGDLAIYSSHLPLDLHPEIGNNILLSKALGLHAIQPSLEIKGQRLGLIGQVKPMQRDRFLERISETVQGRVHLAPGGPDIIKTVLVLTGGAGSEIANAAKLGIDAFVTGEGPHWSYTLAEEMGVNLFYAGHYATECLGIKALASFLSKMTFLPWSFIDHPTGM